MPTQTRRHLAALALLTLPLLLLAGDALACSAIRTHTVAEYEKIYHVTRISALLSPQNLALLYLLMLPSLTVLIVSAEDGARRFKSTKNRVIIALTAPIYMLCVLCIVTSEYPLAAWDSKLFWPFRTGCPSSYQYSSFHHMLSALSGISATICYHIILITFSGAWLFITKHLPVRVEGAARRAGLWFVLTPIVFGLLCIPLLLLCDLFLGPWLIKPSVLIPLADIKF